MGAAKRVVVYSSGAMTSVRPVDYSKGCGRGLGIRFALVVGIVLPQFILSKLVARSD